MRRLIACSFLVIAGCTAPAPLPLYDLSQSGDGGGGGGDLSGPKPDLTGIIQDLSGPQADLTGSPDDLTAAQQDFAVADDLSVTRDLQAPPDLVPGADLAQPICMNGMKDVGESDIDCGGVMCPKCADGKKCNGG